jgi:hypothetical protein
MEPTTGGYPEPDESSPHPQTLSYTLSHLSNNARLNQLRDRHGWVPINIFYFTKIIPKINSVLPQAVCFYMNSIIF